MYLVDAIVVGFIPSVLLLYETLLCSQLVRHLESHGLGHRSRSLWSVKAELALRDGSAHRSFRAE